MMFSYGPMHRTHHASDKLIHPRNCSVVVAPDLQLYFNGYRRVDWIPFVVAPILKANPKVDDHCNLLFPQSSHLRSKWTLAEGGRLWPEESTTDRVNTLNDDLSCRLLARKGAWYGAWPQ
jgi:hypothetical protein